MLNHQGTKILTTARLTLRPFTADDAPAMFRNWASDPEVTKFLTWPTHTSVEISAWVCNDWASHYAEPDYYQWAIEYDGQPIGSMAVVNHDDNVGKAEVGYCIGRSWWHKGIVTEALQAVIDFLFDEVGVERIEAYHDSNNPNSGAVMRKCGMKHEGTMRAKLFNKGKYVDVDMYAILRREFRNWE